MESTWVVEYSLSVYSSGVSLPVVVVVVASGVVSVVRALGFDTAAAGDAAFSAVSPAGRARLEAAGVTL